MGKINFQPDKIRISVVKYANSYPFVWGLLHKLSGEEVVIETDHPSVCAAKLSGGIADIGLLPVAALLQMPDYDIISNYCIGANKKVKTVMLLSNSNIENIHSIYLDYRSVSSVALARILAKFFWKREFTWLETSESFDFRNIPHGHGLVLIGDQCFEYESFFSTGTDLAEEWKKYTGFPFVFACWVAARKPDETFINSFNNALRYGLENIDRVVEEFSISSVMKGKILKKYLTENIDYNLDENKRKGMNLFLKMLKEL